MKIGKLYPVLLTFLAGVSFTVWITNTVYRYEKNLLQNHFSTLSIDNANAIANATKENVTTLEVAGRLFTIFPHLSYQRFEEFSAPIIKNNKNLTSISWMPRVAPDERSEFMAVARTSFPDYTLAVTEEEHDGEIYPMLFSFPLEENDLGKNISSNASCRESLEKARESGQMTSLNRTQANNLGGSEDVMILPVYQQNDSQHDFSGYLVAKFRIDDIVEKYNKSLNRAGITVSIKTKDKFKESMETNAGMMKKSFLKSPFDMKYYLDVVDSKWVLHYRPLPGHFQLHTSQLLWTTFIGGLLTSLLLSLYIYSILRRAQAYHNAAAEKNDQLNHYTQALEKSNEELTHFASIASHDLKEPLRKIRTFSGFLHDEYQDSLPDDAKTYLNHMNNSVIRMTSLIDGLLSYSRIARSQDKFVKVDLSECIEDVISDLELQLKETDGDIDIVNRLPCIEADPVQMRQLFQNIISNALKFHAKERLPKITICSANTIIIDELTKRSIPGVELIIKDNGIGFDDKYAERVFRIFQRLNKRSEYEGSGIGLAVCKKIVERHHGTLTVKSKENVGTTFYIQLPLEAVRKSD